MNIEGDVKKMTLMVEKETADDELDTITESDKEEEDYNQENEDSVSRSIVTDNSGQTQLL